MKVGQGVEVNTGSTSPGRDVNVDKWTTPGVSGASGHTQRGGGASERGVSSANGSQIRYTAS